MTSIHIPLEKWECGWLEIRRPCVVQHTAHHLPNLRELWRAWSQLVLWSQLLCRWANQAHKCTEVRVCKSVSGGRKTPRCCRNCIDTLGSCEWFPFHPLDGKWDLWTKGSNNIYFLHLLYSIDLLWSPLWLWEGDRLQYGLKRLPHGNKPAGADAHIKSGTFWLVWELSGSTTAK